MKLNILALNLMYPAIWISLLQILRKESSQVESCHFRRWRVCRTFVQSGGLCLFFGGLKFFLVLVLEYNLLLIGVIAWNSLDLRKRRNFELVTNIAVEELSFLVKQGLNCRADVFIKLLNQGVLLPVFVHFLLDEAKCPVDDLLVQLQLSLLLVQIFLRALNLHRVEIQELVFLLQNFEQALSEDAFVQDLILNAASSCDLLWVLLFHSMHFSLHLIDLAVKHLDGFFRLLLFIGNRLSHV